MQFIMISNRDKGIETTEGLPGKVCLFNQVQLHRAQLESLLLNFL